MDEDSLTCKLCFNLFKNPVVLPCGHSTCSECAVRLSNFEQFRRQCSAAPTKANTVKHENNNNTNNSFPCPTCNTSICVASISELPPNRDLQHAVEACQQVPKCENCDTEEAKHFCEICDAVLCANCFSDIHKSKVLASHRKSPLAARKAKAAELKLCEKHNNKREIFCKQCSEMICLVCAQFDTSHRGHEMIPLLEHADECKRQLNQFLEKATKTLETLSTIKVDVQNFQREHAKSSENNLAQITTTFDQLIEALQQRKENAVKELKQLIAQKENDLASRLSNLESSIQFVQTLSESVSSKLDDPSLTGYQAADLLKSMRAVNDTLNSEMTPRLPEVANDIRVDISAADAIKKSIANLGESQRLAPISCTLSLKNATSNSLTVMWRIVDPETGAETAAPQNASIDIRIGHNNDSEHKALFVCEGTSGEHTFDGLNSNTQYSVRLRVMIGCMHLTSTEAEFVTPHSYYCGVFSVCGSEMALSNGNRTVVKQLAGSQWNTAYTDRVIRSGEHSWRVRIDAIDSSDSNGWRILFGVSRERSATQAYLTLQSRQGWAMNAYGQKTYSNQGMTFTRFTAKVGDIVTVHLDLDKGTLGFSLNGEFLGCAFDDVTGPVYPAISLIGKHTVTLIGE